MAVSETHGTHPTSPVGRSSPSRAEGQSHPERGADDAYLDTSNFRCFLEMKADLR